MASETTLTPARTRPFSFFEWMVARRYLAATKSGKGVSLISIIAFAGIMLAVAALISVMSIMQGFRLTLLDQLLGVNGHAHVLHADDTPVDNYDAIARALTQVEGVRDATPLIELPVFASANGETGMVVRGVRRDDILRNRYVTGADHVVTGSFENFGIGEKGGTEIALGSRIASQLGVRVGDPITLISGQGPETAFGRTLRRKTYTLGAVFHVGNAEYDAIYGYMPLEQAQLFFGFDDDTVQMIEVFVENPEQIKSYREPLMSVAPDTRIRDWQQRFQSYFNALQIERFAMRLVLFLIVIVATLNIITGLIMLVKDKTGDIAVLRTMGATQGSVMRIFVLSGALIGVLGTIAGIMLGSLFVLNIDAIENGLSAIFRTDLFPAEVYFLDGVPAKLELKEVTLIAGFSLFMSLITTLYPAWRAARLDPVEALRYE
ncbi:lipoprotein-releasing ABC transporter permease subunit [Hyphococcus flavus]|uniref:Lipoprotein-releasing ABC transporter permease subunit n=1 Tax=Hyphococcus flavus TaxID=1866326 RepID=A0AAE9ZCM4_9PROT|nr:lipoprotein-releasing ABC transporter permease subunit [Hyphococcus flavus]WDI31025.1 lipoprotein-releasing ABC transporter permease subunit [Hyphococcus flavus]